MRYCVIGGFGFVGNELCRQLLGQGHQVLAIDNMHRLAPRIDDIRDRVQLAQLDIRNLDALRSAMTAFRPEAILHLAAIHYIPECNQDPSTAYDVNVVGTINVLRVVEELQPRACFVVSSGAVYADSPELLDETQSQVEPVDVYGLSKKACEELVQLYANHNPQITFTAGRLFNVYGPRETNAHIIPEVLSQLQKSDNLALGNVDPRRDMIFVDDVARLMQLLVDRQQGSRCEIVNICTGEDASVRQMVELIAELTGRKVTISVDPSRFRKSDKMSQRGSTRKLQELVGPLQLTQLREGLRRLLEFENFQLA